MESLEITLYDAFPQTVNVLNKQGGIYLEGAAKRSGFGKLLFASTDMNKVINGASVILVILPSLYHSVPLTFRIRWRKMAAQRTLYSPVPTLCCLLAVPYSPAMCM